MIARDSYQKSKAIVEAERKLLEAYLSVIRDTYETADRNYQRRIIRDLESLTLPNSSELFDRLKAKEIRNGNSLTTNQLAEIVGLAEGTLRNIESKGMRMKSNVDEQRFKGRKNYLIWLKEHGYNPFNL